MHLKGVREEEEEEEPEIDEDYSLSTPRYREVYDNAYRKVFVKTLPRDFYPTYWLTFLLCGRPAGKLGRPGLEAGIYFFLFLTFFNL